jgi:hypothetical protein
MCSLLLFTYQKLGAISNCYLRSGKQGHVAAGAGLNLSLMTAANPVLRREGKGTIALLNDAAGQSWVRRDAAWRWL